MSDEIKVQTHAEIKNSPIYKFAEKALPILVWLTITMPIWLSPFHPAVAAYIILGFFVYYLYKAIKMVYYSTISLRLMNIAGKTDWKMLSGKLKRSKEIHHFVMIVAATESESKLDKTLECLTKQDWGSKRVHIMMALEDRVEGSHEKGENLKKKYKKDFASFSTAYHIITPEEVVGKASNASFASKYITDIARKNGYDPKDVLVTVCDADSLMPEQYISYLTYKFLKQEDKEYKFFAAPVLLYNNFWKLPFPVRMQMILSSVARIGFLSQQEDLIQISTYSTNLWLLEKIGYWDVDIIPEDWHIWMQAFYTLGEKVKTVPLYIPIVRDGVLGPTLWKTLRTRYEQEKRWAWGATDVPYAMTRFFHSKHVNFYARLRRLLYVMETHYMWPTAFFTLTISASIPPLINQSFERTVLGLLLPKVASFILTGASILLFLTVYLDYSLRKKVNIETSWKQVPMLFVQWYMLPVVSFIFSSLPALEAHTRMLIGKKLEYRITEKVG